MVKSLFDGLEERLTSVVRSSGGLAGLAWF